MLNHDFLWNALILINFKQPYVLQTVADRDKWRACDYVGVLHLVNHYVVVDIARRKINCQHSWLSKFRKKIVWKSTTCWLAKICLKRKGYKFLYSILLPFTPQRTKPSALHISVLFGVTFWILICFAWRKKPFPFRDGGKPFGNNIVNDIPAQAICS